MEWRDMPPLAALRAFSAFAERGGVVAAAGALNVSHAAIGQQLRALEAHLDIALLDRSGRALQLTSDGEALAQALTVGFGAIRSTLQEMTQTSGGRPVHIACTPMFATYWLMPRLADFRTRHPEIDLAIDPKGELVELRPGGVDIALRYGTGPWPGLQSEMLLQSPMVVVAPPGLLQDREIKTPQDLLSLPWLEEIGTNEASHWLRSRGVEPDMKAGRVVLPGTLLMNALFAGQGVAVAVRDFVAADLDSGRLVELFSEPGPSGYHIAFRPDVMRPAARHFLQWLRRMRDKSLT